MIWLLFIALLVLSAATFLGGLCAVSGKSEREIERLEGDRK
jgi:hypothetical protein